MHSVRFGLLFCFLLVSVPICAQQTQPVPTLPPAKKDTQAISIINQALSVAGGIQAIATIKDYTCTGTITYHKNVDRDVQGTVTIRAGGLNQLRMDTTLPSGTRSEVTNGRITIKDENGVVTKLYGQPPLGPARLVLPYLQLKAALTSNDLNLLYKGVVIVDGHPTQYIQVQHILPGDGNRNLLVADFLSMDFFIDSLTFQVVMMQDFVQRYLVRQIRYSDFRAVNGVQVPFSISEKMQGQDTWLMQLGQISFNSGVQVSDFKL